MCCTIDRARFGIRDVMIKALTIRFKKAIENRRRELESEIHSHTLQIVTLGAALPPLSGTSGVSGPRFAKPGMRRSAAGVSAKAIRVTSAQSGSRRGPCPPCKTKEHDELRQLLGKGRGGGVLGPIESACSAGA